MVPLGVPCRLQERLYSPQQLNELMAASDYVIMATPHTPATHQLINAAAIAAMKPNGVLVNVGRGKCIDEAALIDGELACCMPWCCLDAVAADCAPAAEWTVAACFLVQGNRALQQVLL